MESCRLNGDRLGTKRSEVVRGEYLEWASCRIDLMSATNARAAAAMYSAPRLKTSYPLTAVLSVKIDRLRFRI
jgi:hypothetical protein